MEVSSDSIALSALSYDGPTALYEIQVFGRSSLRQMITTISSVPISAQEWASGGCGTTTQQVAIADALTTTGNTWNVAMTNTSTNGHGAVTLELDAMHGITAGYYQPYTNVICDHDAIRGPMDTDPVAFPAYSGPSVQMIKAIIANNSDIPEEHLIFPNLTKSDIWNTTGPAGDYRLRWVELPFNDTAIGAIVLVPRSPENLTQELLMCSVGAGWGLSTMNVSTIVGDATPVLGQVNAQALSNIFGTGGGGGNANGTPPYPGSEQTQQLTEDRLIEFYPPVFPERPIKVTEDWARFLNPSIEFLNTTIFNSIMEVNITSEADYYRLIQAELALAQMMANGLSRIGSTSQLQGIVKQVVESDKSVGLDGNYWFAGKGNNVFQVNPVDSKDWVKFRVSTTIEGYSYNTQGTTTRLAIGVLLAYCLVAIAHIIYAGISGISSTCWDSIGEVTALAMNSTHTAALRNTCAGITKLNIFKLPIRVLAFRDTEGDGEHLELVFGKPDEKTLENQTIKANRVYGTMPNMKGMIRSLEGGKR